MESHTDNHKSEDKQTLQEKGNIYGDVLEDEALKAAEQDNIVIDSDFPFEQLCVKTGPSKVAGSLCKAIQLHWDTPVARAFFHTKELVPC